MFMFYGSFPIYGPFSTVSIVDFKQVKMLLGKEHHFLNENTKFHQEMFRTCTKCTSVEINKQNHPEKCRFGMPMLQVVSLLAESESSSKRKIT